jgi:membrane protein required for beta-lactamase induction
MISWLKIIARGLLDLLRYLANQQLIDAGEAQASARALQDSAKRERQGRDAVAQEIDQTAGADQRKLIKRLRERDGEW